MFVARPQGDRPARVKPKLLVLAVDEFGNTVEQISSRQRPDRLNRSGFHREIVVVQPGHQAVARDLADECQTPPRRRIA